MQVVVAEKPIIYKDPNAYLVISMNLVNSRHTYTILYIKASECTV